MTGLLEQLQTATEGSRDLDAQIWLHLEYPDYKFPSAVLNRKPACYAEAVQRLTHDGFGGGVSAPNYTTNLQDAVSPAEQVGMHPVEVLERAILWMKHDHPQGPLTIDLLCRYCCMVIIKAHESKAEAA